MAWRGKFKPKNPQKYVGDPEGIVYRSRIELRYFQYIDQHPDIIAWGSEEVIVKYFDPMKYDPQTGLRGKVRRYFPDIVLKKKGPDGKVQTIMVEFKHSSEAREPKPKKKTRRAITEVETWITNNAKWEAAKSYCADMGWHFMVLTEKELGKAYY